MGHFKKKHVKTASPTSIMELTDKNSQPSQPSSDPSSDTPPPPVQAGPPPPPNGGTLAWVQVAGSWCLWFATWGLVNSFGVFQAYYETDLLRHESSSRISWIGSLQLCLFIFGTVVVGPLYDIGFLRTLLVVGAFLTVFGMMMTSICHQYWQFILAQGVCMGLGMTCLFVPSIALIPAYFTTRRALAAGISATGSSIGAIILAVIFEQLTPVIGFGWTTRIIGFILLASLILPILGLQKRIAHSPRRAIVDPDAFKEPTFLILGVVMVVAFIGQYIPFFYVEVFSIQKQILTGSNADLNRWLIVFLNVGSSFGRLIPNILADKIGPFNTMIPCTVITALIAFCWIAVTSKAGLIAFAIFYGFFSGSFVSLTPVVWAAVSPNLKVLGTRIGMMAVCMAIGLLIGNPIAGALINGTDFVPLQAFCGATVVAAAAFLVISRVVKAGPNPAVKV